MIRKIISKEQQEKNRTRNQLIVGLVLIVIMLLSVAGYAINFEEKTNTATKINYHGIDFVKNGEYWQFNFNGQDFITSYNPKEIEDIKIFTNLSIKDYSNKPLYFVGEGGQSLEIARNLNNNVLRVQNACLSEKNCTEGLPIKNCTSDNIIVIREAFKDEKENVYQEDKCVFIIASYLNQTRYSDAVLFKTLGM